MPPTNKDNPDHELDQSNSAMAPTSASGARGNSPPADPAPHGDVDGDGGGADRRGADPGTTRIPLSATRYVETTLGTLSYAALAPHLGANVAAIEDDIRRREFAVLPLDEDLILDLHRRLVMSLIPDIAGRWRRRNVIVGTHEPPVYFQVPMLMREYVRDLNMRLRFIPEQPDDVLLELLAFAEGRLLTIHPFEDFNGRVTRLFLIELLYRLDLPVANPATESDDEREIYFEALRAADKFDYEPLAGIWRGRFERESYDL